MNVPPVTQPFQDALGTWLAWASALQPPCHVLTSQQARLVSLFDALVTANQHTNLTRIQSVEDFINRHVWESVAPLLSPAIQPMVQNKTSTLKLIDVGSGAGFPLLIWVAYLEAVGQPYAAVAVEATAKKARFIEQVAEAWQLTHGTLTVRASRVEDLGQSGDYRDTFDLVTARAVAALPSLLEVCLPLAKPHTGKFLAWKGSAARQELSDAAKIIDVFRGQHQTTLSAPSPWSLQGQTPYEGHLLDVLVFTKSTPTPPGYPRRNGLPFHKPLLA
jgi:16S rRNA (guanine527-N7)-methyltransferase